MELIIENKIRNDLLNREEITAISKSEITPKTDEIKTALAEKLGKNSELIVVRRIKGKFGSKDFLVEAYIYDNLEVLKKFEPVQKKKEKPAQAAAKSEEKPEEKQEKKEEKQEIKEEKEAKSEEKEEDKGKEGEDKGKTEEVKEAKSA